MDKLPEWITAIATVVATGGVWLVWKQIKADHERSRRENAINYLFEWSRGLLRNNSLARRLAETLDEKQTMALIKEQPLTLESDKKDLVLGCLSDPSAALRNSSGDIQLGVKEVAELRWQVVRYLNLLECIFTAGRHGVADRDILIEQFGYLVDPKEGHHLLKKFRDAMGGSESFPALSDLEKVLEEKYRQRGAGKAPIATRA